MKPLVSVLIVTYNHKKFITQAIESALIQKTNFGFEIVVGEDCSNDGTREICIKYQKENPDKIKLLLNEKNVGMIRNFLSTLKACSGKYIAICEGDDYWTDADKLQKQVDFLEANPEYGLVYTDIDTINASGDKINTTFLQRQRSNYSEGYVFHSMLQKNIVHTLTVLVRTKIIQSLTEEINDKQMIYVYDYWYWLRTSLNWKFKFFNEITAHYRVHQGGVSNQPAALLKKSEFAKMDAILKYFEEKSSFENDEKKYSIIVEVIFNLLLSKNISLNDKKNIISILTLVPASSIVKALKFKMKKKLTKKAD